jgi:hypothetical protein
MKMVSIGLGAMAEPRARMARHKGQMNFQNERKFLQLTRIRR